MLGSPKSEDATSPNLEAVIKYYVTRSLKETMIMVDFFLAFSITTCSNTHIVSPASVCIRNRALKRCHKTNAATENCIRDLNSALLGPDSAFTRSVRGFTKRSYWSNLPTGRLKAAKTDPSPTRLSKKAWLRGEGGVDDGTGRAAGHTTVLLNFACRGKSLRQRWVVFPSQISLHMNSLHSVQRETLQLHFE